MLAIEVCFLTGRYVATRYNDRRQPEWPPHPARLFSALVATHHASLDPSPSERELLLWLEALDAPQIAKSDHSERELVTVFVPVNDGGVLKDFGDELLAIDEARARTDKNLAKLEKKLSDAIAKDIAAPAKISKGGPDDAAALLPEHRGKQPRTFPSVTPIDPRVTYIWPDAAPTAAQRETLDGLLARLVRLGHSSSFVSARLVDPPPPATLVPAEAGERLRVTRAGQLAALEDAHGRHREVEPRVMPARFQSYAAPTSDATESAPGSVFGDEWLVLRRVGGPHLPATAGPGVARALRRALLSIFGKAPIPELVSGHRADGSPSERDHVAFVPLPFVAHPHADGSLLGVALVLPRTVDDADRKALFRAIARWEKGRAVDAPDDEPVLELTLGPAGVWRLARVVGDAPQSTLRPATWCEESTTWVTATPIALDRNPGELRADDPARLAKAVAEASATIAAACVRIGLPRPTTIHVLPAAPLAGASKAKHYPPFGPKATPRILTHARLVFPSPVRGPLLVGAGRYFGLGLLRPEKVPHA